MVGVTVRLVAKPGREHDLEDILRQMTLEVASREPGCLLYQPTRSRHDPRTYLVLERYENDEALANHSNGAHYQEALNRLMECLDGLPEIALFDELTTTAAR